MYLGDKVIVVGSSGAGKTTLVRKLLDDRERYFGHPIQKLYWFYGVDTGSLPSGPDVYTFEGLPTTDMLEDMRDSIVIIDDLQFLINSSQKNKQILNNLFCLYAHHYNFLLMTLFHNVMEISRSARLSATHYLLFGTNNERVQITNLLRQLFKQEQVSGAIQAYENAMSRPYQHILIDNSIHCDPKLRVMSQIDSEHPIVYDLRNSV